MRGSDAVMTCSLRLRPWIVACCWFVGVAAPAHPAGAQTAPGFAANRFDPAERGSDWFALDSLDLRGHLRPAAGLVLDWGRKPLVIYDTDGTARANLVEDQLFAFFGGAVIIADRLRLGGALPVALATDGENGTLGGVRYQAPDGAALGDVRLSGDVRLVGRRGEPGTMALGVALYLPTGSQGDYASDGRVRVAPRLALAGDVGAATYAAKVAMHFRAENRTGYRVGHELAAGLAAGVRALEDRMLLGAELLIGTALDDFFGDQQTPVELLFGAHARLGEAFRAGVGVGPGLSDGVGTPEMRLLASLTWMPPATPPDGDGDGIADREDACPTVPGPRTGDPATHGCPPPPDRDGDGIVDGQDACPAARGVRTADPATNGCPPPPPDRDADGVPDGQDACPDVPGLKTADPATNGCPADRDGDGVPDGQDACPDVPGIKTAEPATNGCPSDRDRDGILDAEDACPDAAGPRDADRRKHGCPAARIEAEQIKIVEQVQFRTASSRILPVSQRIIDAVADVLKRHPQITRVRIEGHTDDVGPDAYNKRLSAQRAAAVLNALVRAGVERSRLHSVGHGEERPLERNDSEEGRQANRRVEFHIEQGGAAAP